MLLEPGLPQMLGVGAETVARLWEARAPAKQGEGSSGLTAQDLLSGKSSGPAEGDSASWQGPDGKGENAFAPRGKGVGALPANGT